MHITDDISICVERLPFVRFLLSVSPMRLCYKADVKMKQWISRIPPVTTNTNN